LKDQGIDEIQQITDKWDESVWTDVYGSGQGQMAGFQTADQLRDCKLFRKDATPQAELERESL
jgi:hypothetical protein